MEVKSAPPGVPSLEWEFRNCLASVRYSNSSSESGISMPLGTAGLMSVSSYLGFAEDISDLNCEGMHASGGYVEGVLRIIGDKEEGPT